MYSELYDSILEPKKVECSRCHRKFDEDTADMEPDDYGGLLCHSCRTPTMAIHIPWWMMEDSMKETEWWRN